MPRTAEFDPQTARSRAKSPKTAKWGKKKRRIWPFRDEGSGGNFRGPADMTSAFPSSSTFFHHPPLSEATFSLVILLNPHSSHGDPSGDTFIFEGLKN